VYKLRLPKDSLPPPQPNPDWTAIAQELLNENDERKVQELSQRLINAIDQRLINAIEMQQGTS